MTRIRAALVAVAMLMVVAFAVGDARPQATDAAWAASQYGASGPVNAATLVAPSVATCVPTSAIIVGLQSVTLTWSSPQQGNQRVDITRGATTGSDTGNIVQTGFANGLYQYSATYTTAKLLGLVNLTDLLGGTYTIRIYTGYPVSVWWSQPTSFTLSVILLGLGTSCTAA